MNHDLCDLTHRKKNLLSSFESTVLSNLLIFYTLPYIDLHMSNRLTESCFVQQT